LDEARSRLCRRAGERPIDPLLNAAGFAEASSDQRFTMLYKHLRTTRPLPRSAHERRHHEVRFGLLVATATVTDKAFVLRLYRAFGLGFGDFWSAVSRGSSRITRSPAGRAMAKPRTSTIPSGADCAGKGLEY
jgi:hypothetical protein